MLFFMMFELDLLLFKISIYSWYSFNNSPNLNIKLFIIFCFSSFRCLLLTIILSSDVISDWLIELVIIEFLLELIFLEFSNCIIALFICFSFFDKVIIFRSSSLSFKLYNLILFSISFASFSNFFIFKIFSLIILSFSFLNLISNFILNKWLLIFFPPPI